MCEAAFIHVNHKYVLPWLYTLLNFNNFLHTIQGVCGYSSQLHEISLIVNSAFEI